MCETVSDSCSSSISVPTDDTGLAVSPGDVRRLRMFRAKVMKEQVGLKKRLLLKRRKTYVKSCNALLTHENGEELLCLDSGASSTLLKKSALMRRILNRVKMKIKDAVGKSHSSGGSGPTNIFVRTLEGKIIQLPSCGDAHFLPTLLHNLLSVSQLCSAGCTVIFKHHNSKIVCPAGDVIPVEEKNGLYFVPSSSGAGTLRSVSMPKLFANLARTHALKKKLTAFNGVVSNESVCDLLDKEELDESAAYRKPPALRYWKHTRSLEGARNAARAWHVLHRLGGHCSREITDGMLRSGKFGKLSMPDEADKYCDVCQRGKFARPPVPKKSVGDRSAYPGLKWHTDVIGPFRADRHGYKYVVNFVDDATGYIWARALKKKSDACEAFRDFLKWLSNAVSEFPNRIHNIAILQSDRGGEYTSGPTDKLRRHSLFDSVCDTHNIRRCFTSAYTPAENGRAERANRTLCDTMRCNLLDSRLGWSYWVNAYLAGLFSRNRIPSSKGKLSKFEHFYGKVPAFSRLVPFGSVAHVTILYQKSDLDRSKPVRMVGYPMDARGWTFVDSRGKLIVTRHTRFYLRHIDERNPDFQPGVEVVQLPGFDIGLTDSELRKRCYNFDNEIVKWSDPTSCDKAGDTCPTDAIPVTPSPIRDSPSGIDSSPVSVLDFDEPVVCQRKRTGPSAPVLLSDLKNMPPNTRIEVRQDNPKSGLSRIRYEAYKGSSTIAEYLQRSNGWKDLKHDFVRRYVRVLDSGSCPGENCALSALIAKLSDRKYTGTIMTLEEASDIISEARNRDYHIFFDKSHSKFGIRGKRYRQYKYFENFDDVDAGLLIGSMKHDDFISDVAKGICTFYNHITDDISTSAFNMAPTDRTNLTTFNNKFNDSPTNNPNIIQRLYELRTRENLSSIKDKSWHQNLIALAHVACVSGTSRPEYVNALNVFALNTINEVVCGKITPLTTKEAKSLPEWPLWIESMNKEVTALRDLGVFELVPRRDVPSGKKVVKTRFVYKIKQNKDGSIRKYKSRLIAQGFLLRYGIDYYDTYSSVVGYSTIRTLMALSANTGATFSGYDVGNAYCESSPDDDTPVYVEQPPEMHERDPEEYVYRLRKSLYGCGFSGRTWERLTNEFMVNELGFKMLATERSVFTKVVNGSQIIIGCYVDDFLCLTKDEQLRAWFESKLRSRFKTIESSHNLEWILNMGLKQYVDSVSKKRCVEVTQTLAIEKITEMMGLKDCKRTPTPLVEGTKMMRTTTEDESANTSWKYASVLGGVLYIANVTRPDIAYCAHALTRYLRNPNKHHHDLLKRLVRYLYHTRHVGLKYSSGGTNPYRLSAASDSSFADCVDTNRSTLGWCLWLGDEPSGVISWGSRISKTTALSTTKAEVQAALEALRDVLWFRDFLGELGYIQPGSTRMWQDNNGAIGQINATKGLKKARHYLTALSRLNEEKCIGTIHMKRIDSEENVADLFTKILGGTAHIKLSSMALGFNMSFLRGSSYHQRAKKQLSTVDADAKAGI